MQSTTLWPPHWKFLFLTFGCKVNQYETEALREAWCKLGGQECKDPQAADVICINSCAITAKGERDCRAAIYRIRRANQHAKLILTGCAALLCANLGHAKDLQIDAIVPQANKASLLAGPFKLLPPTSCAPTDIYPPFAISSYQRARPVLKIQDGCTHHCTYCIVPNMRPVLASRSPQDIVAEARRLLTQGFPELIISGINLKLYAKDKPEFGDFWHLLNYLEQELSPEYAGRARLRLSSIEPSQLTPQGLETLAAGKLLCPHLHISLQHVTPHILQRMGRGHYRVQQLTSAIETIQKFWPTFALGCDLISGFPGEDAAAHQELLAVCQDIPFTYAHIFPYSARPNTVAAAFHDQIPSAVKLQRAAELRQLFQEKKRAFTTLLLQKQDPLHVVFDSKIGTQAKGVCEYYVQCHCNTHLDSAHKLHTMLPVEITEHGIIVQPQR